MEEGVRGNTNGSGSQQGGLTVPSSPGSVRAGGIKDIKRFGSAPLDRPTKTSQIVGEFYELLAREMLGGELVDKNPGSVSPDLELWRKQTWVEVKSTHKWSDFKFQHYQFEKYEEMLLTEFPFRHPQIDFLLFVHNLYRMTEQYKTEGRLARALVAETICAVRLSFGDLINMLAGFPIYTWSRNYGPAMDYKLMPARVIRELGCDGKMIPGIRGLSKRRRMVAGKTVDGIPVKPFCLLTLRKGRGNDR